MNEPRATAAVSASLLLLSMGTTALAQDPPLNEGIVSSVVKAPIVPDGDVAGAQTDIVIDLDTSLDPAVEGRTLLAGKQIRITFPEDFQSRDVNVGPAAACERPCNTGIILQGWPQRPFPPIPDLYSVEMDGSHTIVLAAAQDLAPGVTPGIKQFHVNLGGFTNPKAGDYAIAIEAETGRDGAIEVGTGVVTIHPAIRPSINVTSVFAKANPDDPNGNTIYQLASAGESPAWAWDFLIWDADGTPALDVEVRQDDDSGGDIVQGDAVIGSFTIEAPEGATGQRVVSEPSVGIDSPVSGVPTGRLTARFTAGDLPGSYVTTFELDGGNTQQMFVNVAE